MKAMKINEPTIVFRFIFMIWAKALHGDSIIVFMSTMGHQLFDFSLGSKRGSNRSIMRVAVSTANIDIMTQPIIVL